ncbi:type II toxin-antitoxin system Phd/YefM family antitoxin [Williamsia sp. M5A3_1d]
MKVITQRELRNDNAEIVRGVEDGESYTVTRRGVPVARLVPIDADTDFPCDRPATTRHRWADRKRVVLPVSTGEIIDDLRGDR